MTTRPSIAIVSQKGGVWKSTLSCTIAQVASKDDWQVHIADLDFQQMTTTLWVGRRMAGELQPKIYSAIYATVEDAIKRTAGGNYDLVIFDGPARAFETTAKVARAVDLVIQPTSPSLEDLEPAVSLFHDLVKVGIPKSRLVYALINSETEAEEADARYYLERSGYNCLGGSIPNRPAFRQALNSGKALTEVGQATLRRRACELVTSIGARLFMDVAKTTP